MGARGPAPTPKAELNRRGSWRGKKRPAELTLPAKPPAPPSTLSKEARAEWKRLVKLLGPKSVLAEADRIAMTMVCELWAEDRELGASLKKLLQGSTDWKRVFTARQNVRRQLAALLPKFGMTPADRPRVKAGQGNDDPTSQNGPIRNYKFPLQAS